MNLFPKCRFALHFEHGGLVPDDDNDGELRLFLPEPISSVRNAFLELRSSVEITHLPDYGRRGAYREEERLFAYDFTPRLRSEWLSSGPHVFPFSLRAPALPPNVSSDLVEARTVARMWLSVAGAFDPSATCLVPIALPPHRETAVPHRSRSSSDFHLQLALDVGLDSSTVVVGDVLRGRVALVAGAEVAFDTLSVCLSQRVRSHVGDARRRSSEIAVVRFPRQALLAGDAVVFELPTDGLVPDYHGTYLETGATLELSLDTWGMDSTMVVPLRALPSGSTLLEAEPVDLDVGTGARRKLAAEVAARTGSVAGEAPTIVTGEQAHVGFALTYALHKADLIRVRFAFPSLGLGTRFRPLGLLEGFRGSPLLPDRIATGFLLRCDHVPSHLTDDDLARFFDRIFAPFAGAGEVLLDDVSLEVTEPAEERESVLVDLATVARTHAGRVAEAIADLPFPPDLGPAARSAWRDLAYAEQAMLLPHIPGLARARRVRRGAVDEASSFCFDLAEVRREGQTRTELRVHFDVPFPKGSSLVAARESALLGSLRALFSDFETTVTAEGRLVLVGRRAGALEDPRVVLPALGGLLDWAVAIRGALPPRSPYR